MSIHEPCIGYAIFGDKMKLKYIIFLIANLTKNITILNAVEILKLKDVLTRLINFSIIFANKKT